MPREYKYNAHDLRGLYLFVAWVRDGSPLAGNATVPRSFFEIIPLRDRTGNFYKMIFTEKDIKYADLVVPFTKCPLGEAVKDCPFMGYWEIEDQGKRIRLIDKLPEAKLDELRDFHQKCLAIKIQKARKESTLFYENQK